MGIKMKNIINNMTLILMALSVMACDSVDNKEGITDNTITSTSQLIAPKDMKFISHKGISLAVDINNQGGGPAYLSVYSNYQYGGNNTWLINHDSRIIASSMGNSQIDHDFAIPQHLKKLLVQVWFYDGRPALSHEITIANQVSITF